MHRYSHVSSYSRVSFSCEFCDIIEIYGRVPRTKSNQQMLAELDELKRIGWRGTVFVVDDNFIGNKRNVRKLLPDLVEWQEKNGFPFSLLTEASANLADDDDLLETMRSAGFRRVFLGIETPVEASLKEAQKTQNRGNLLESVKKIQSYGMEVMGGFIVGFDNDPTDIFERQINSSARAQSLSPWWDFSPPLHEPTLAKASKGRPAVAKAAQHTGDSLISFPNADPTLLAKASHDFENDLQLG